MFRTAFVMITLLVALTAATTQAADPVDLFDGKSMYGLGYNLVDPKLKMSDTTQWNIRK